MKKNVASDLAGSSPSSQQKVLKTSLSMLCLIVVAAAASLAQTTIPPTYFGMHMTSGVAIQPPKTWSEPWPIVPFEVFRMWDAGTRWSQVNPSAGVYDWSLLDKWLSDTQSFGTQRVIYTFGSTPAWASSHPYDTSCAAAWGPGTCDPPNDLNADGTGTNQHWKNFVTALATHAGTKVQYWEIWNEPKNSFFWNGTIAQLVRMAKDARSIIISINPNAVMLTPPGRDQWQLNYFAAGGANYADVITFHGRVTRGICGMYPIAANEITVINTVKSHMAAYGQSSKPLWDTEFSWGPTSQSCFTNKDLQAGFLAQSYLLQWSNGVRSLVWYQYNNSDNGTLWSPNPNQPSAAGTLLTPGIASEQMYDWMVGATMSSPCSLNGTVWSCKLTRPGGYAAMAIWDPSQTCGNGSCTTVGRSVDPMYHYYRTLAGTKQAISGTMVPVGYKPILLENQ